MSEYDIPARPVWVLGLDLGQANDWTALCANRMTAPVFEPIAHEIAGLERWRGERYPEIVRTVKARVEQLRGPAPRIDPHLARYYGAGALDRRPDVVLVVDYTGVGRPVVDMFEEADLDCAIVPVTITAGLVVMRSEDGHDYRVPKRILASTLHVLMQTGRAKVAEGLALREVFVKEARNFRARITSRGNDTYGAGEDWRDEDGKHDDLILAVSLACWGGEEQVGTGRFEPMSNELIAQLQRMGD